MATSPRDQSPLAGPVPLTSVPAGAVATLQTVADPEARLLLRGLGLLDASRLRLCKAGDPCIVQVRSTRIGLSHAVARHLMVVPDAAAGE